MNAANKEARAVCHRAIRARIALIADERGLPKSETKKGVGASETRRFAMLRSTPPHQRRLADLRRP
jgi:hypothetical protein